MRQIVIDQKSMANPQPAAATVQTDKPTPISLKGLWLKESKNQKLLLKQINGKFP